jgi:hypothetical protein
VKVFSRIEPQPPPGIKYMLGGESWMQDVDRSPVRLFCEEWGSLGPMELDPEIRPNKAGFRVRHTEILAPAGAIGFARVDGVYYWTAN